MNTEIGIPTRAFFFSIIGVILGILIEVRGDYLQYGIEVLLIIAALSLAMLLLGLYYFWTWIHTTIE